MRHSRAKIKQHFRDHFCNLLGLNWFNVSSLAATTRLLHGPGGVAFWLVMRLANPQG
jgi:hypothetical protein